MVERLFIHNYKGFVNFEVKFGRTVLLVGRNGSGKSSLLDRMHALVMVMSDGGLADRFEANTRFRFGNLPNQHFELDVRLGEHLFRYRLEVSFNEQDERPFVVLEELTRNGEQLFLFHDGQFRLGTAAGNGNPSILSVDRYRGGLAIVFESHLPDTLKEWVRGFLMMRLVPSQVGSVAAKRGVSIFTDGSDFASWYESVSSADTQALVAYLDTMRDVMPGLKTINLKALHKRGKLWEAEFQTNGHKASFTLEELSDGQIGLIVLYALVRFWLRSGATLALDEPDNYLALSEIEPLIHTIDDAVEHNLGQVFLISHHPEFYNRWARYSERCRHLVRTEDGLFVESPIDWNEYTGLMPAEVVARGWQDA